MARQAQVRGMETRAERAGFDLERTLGLLLGLVGLMILLMALNVRGVEARDGYSNASLRGAWGFSADGVIVPPAVPMPTHAVAVGLMRFDGKGACSISDTINIGGMAAGVDTPRESIDCSYHVRPDGTGTITAQFVGEPFPVPLSFVIVDGGREFRWIRTDLGIASGVAKRQRPD